MADTQILPTGTLTAPGDYVLPTAQIVTIGAVFAHYDGSGAAGSYVPTLDILSDSGHTILSVPHDTTITAGSNAEASWAPFLETVKAGVSTGTGNFGYAEASAASFTVPSGAVTKFQYGSTSQTGTSNFGFVNVPVDTITYTGGIWVEYHVTGQWSSFAADRYVEVSWPDGNTGYPVIPDRVRNNATPGGDLFSIDGWRRGSFQSLTHAYINVFQNSGVNQTITNLDLIIIEQPPYITLT